MGKLILLLLVGAAAVGAYNYSNGRDILSVPSTSAIKDSVRDTVQDSVQSAARQTRAEIKEHASESVHSAVNRAEEAVTEATLTSKIKAKMALDDLVKASNISVRTEGSVVTLSGTVASNDEQKRAVRIASETTGVTKVVNHLKVH
jgi:hyperosmotically inducible protein